MSAMDSFSFFLPVNIRFGCGVTDEIQKSTLPGKRVMLVTGGKTIRKNGTVDRLLEMVRGKAETVMLFDDVSANPSLRSVMNGAAAAREGAVDCVIGLGGGSALDTAKGIAAMAVNEGSLWDYTSSGSGSGKTLVNKPLPLIAVPTTAGTGSEANKTAVITDTERNEKIGIRTDFPFASYIDPELTLSIPARHTAEQGFDAFCHCLEAFTSVKANPMSDVLSLSGMRAIYEWLPRAVEMPNDIEARCQMCYGSMIGGMVLFLSSASAAHTMEHMLSGMNPAVTHGGGLAMIFDAFHAKMAEHVPQRYAEIADALGLSREDDPVRMKAEKLLDVLRTWKEKLGLNELKLRDFGFTAEQADEMVRMTHWVGGGPLTRDRYRLSDDDIADILISSIAG